MSDFAKMLSDKMKKATEATRPPEPTEPKEPTGEGTPAAAMAGKPAPEKPVKPPKAQESPTPAVEPTPEPKAAPVASAAPKKPKAQQVPIRGGGSNLNRVTVNLFDADRRALAIIKEHLANSGYDFTNRSDSIKIALRIAAKATKEELTQILHEVRGEDRRFSGRDV